MATPTIDSEATERSASESATPTSAGSPTEVAGSRASTAGNAVRRAVRYAGQHPFRAIGAAALAGALINAERAFSLGVVASLMVLLFNPNGREKRQRLDRQLRRLGRGAVTAVRERAPSDPSTPSESGAQRPRA